MTSGGSLATLARKMKKTFQILFFLFGMLGPFLIGALHTWTHFSQLTGPEVQNQLSMELMINGTRQSYWNTWGIMSFMFGVSMMVLGLLNAAHSFRKGSFVPPPVSVIVIMLCFLGCVVYAGIVFEQVLQLIGGLSGSAAMGVCLLLRGRLKMDTISKSNQEIYDLEEMGPGNCVMDTD